MTTMFLGGSASPIGGVVQYVDAEFGRVLDGLVEWRGGLSGQLEVSDALPLPQVLHGFVPFQTPWIRELLVPCGRWTAYLNNATGGGDPSASISAIARRLDVRWVMAMHSPPDDAGHQATQLWVCGPEGEPPLMYERVLAAHAEGGRWGWEESGRPFPFEDLDRYRSRRRRDRFDRALLLVYLRALGIPADDDAAYGPGVIVQQHHSWHTERPPRLQTLAEARAQLAGRRSPRLR